MFEDALQFRQAISLCYSRQTLALQARIPSAQTWAVANAVVSTLSPVVSTCILNQSCGHWLLGDALNAAITMSLQYQQHASSLGSQVEFGLEDFDVELEELNTKMRREVIGVLAPFLAFIRCFDKTRAHNMLALMLDPCFKGLSLVSSFVGREDAIGIVAEYDEKSLMPLLIACYRVLNPTIPVENASRSVALTSLDLFQVGATEAETSKELVKRELSLFRRIQIDVGNCVDPLQWWRSHESTFPTVGLLARQILGIAGSQIETERIFSIAGVLTALRRCRLQTNNLDKLIFVAKNWPDDPRLGCSQNKVLEEFKEVEANLVEELEEEFESTDLFEDEI